MTQKRRVILASLLAVWVGMVHGCAGGDGVTPEEAKKNAEAIKKVEEANAPKARLEAAKASRAKTECKELALQVEIYKISNGRLPSSIEQLTQKQAAGRKPLLPVDKIKDPWGKTYQLDTRGPKIRVLTTTPEGETVSNLP